MTTPSLHRVSSHSYDVLSDVDGLIALLDTLLLPLGGPKAGDHYRLRWKHGATLVLLFDGRNGSPPRLCVMGAQITDLDELAVEVVE